MFIQIKKKIILSTLPNTEACETTNVMFHIEELQFLIETYCFLLT